MLQSDLSPGPFRKGGQGGFFMQLPEIPLDPPLRKGETPCLRRTHVKMENQTIETITPQILNKLEETGFEEDEINTAFKKIN